MSFLLTGVCSLECRRLLTEVLCRFCVGSSIRFISVVAGLVYSLSIAPNGLQCAEIAWDGYEPSSSGCLTK